MKKKKNIFILVVKNSDDIVIESLCSMCIVIYFVLSFVKNNLIMILGLVLEVGKFFILINLVIILV